VQAGTTGVIRDWLAEGDISSWRDQLEASPTELADLLAFVRAPGARLIAAVLDGEAVPIPYAPRQVPDGAGFTEVDIRWAMDEPEPRPLLVFGDDVLIGEIGPIHHDHVAQMLSLGVALQFSVSPSEPNTVEVRLAEGAD
jgi:hypothetical protein